MTATRRYKLLVSAGFALFAALYFLGRGTTDPAWVRPAVKTLPVLFLAAATWRIGRNGLPLLPSALLLSSMGDLAGDLHAFLWQIALFAAAHAAYIAVFVRRWKPTRASLAASALLAAAVLCAAYRIIAHIPGPAERAFVAIYMAVIATMAVAAMSQDTPYRWAYAAAALLFIFSDGCIAWNRYLVRIPHAAVWIMSTYFIAQFSFARLYLAERLR